MKENRYYLRRAAAFISALSMTMATFQPGMSALAADSDDIESINEAGSVNDAVSVTEAGSSEDAPAGAPETVNDENKAEIKGFDPKKSEIHFENNNIKIKDETIEIPEDVSDIVFSVSELDSYKFRTDIYSGETKLSSDENGKYRISSDEIRNNGLSFSYAGLCHISWQISCDQDKVKFYSDSSFSSQTDKPEVSDAGSFVYFTVDMDMEELAAVNASGGNVSCRYQDNEYRYSVKLPEETNVNIEVRKEKRVVNVICDQSRLVKNATIRFEGIEGCKVSVSSADYVFNDEFETSRQSVQEFDNIKTNGEYNYVVEYTGFDDDPYNNKILKTGSVTVGCIDSVKPVINDVSYDVINGEYYLHCVAEDADSGVEKIVAVNKKNKNDKTIIFEKEENKANSFVSKISVSDLDFNDYHVYAMDNAGCKSDIRELKDFSRRWSIEYSQKKWIGKDLPVKTSVSGVPEGSGIIVASEGKDPSQAVRDYNVFLEKLNAQKQEVADGKRDKTDITFSGFYELDKDGNAVINIKKNGSYHLILITPGEEGFSLFETRNISTDIIDKDIPEVTIVKRDDQSKSKKEITYTIEASDTGAGIDHIEYKYSGQETWKAVDTGEQSDINSIKDVVLTIDEEVYNEKIIFRATDKMGNVSQEVSGSFNDYINKSVPDFEADYNIKSSGFVSKIINTLSFNMFFKDQADISICLDRNYLEEHNRDHNKDDNGNKLDISNVYYMISEDVIPDVSELMDPDKGNWNEVSDPVFSYTEDEVSCSLNIEGTTQGYVYIKIVNNQETTSVGVAKLDGESGTFVCLSSSDDRLTGAPKVSVSDSDNQKYEGRWTGKDVIIKVEDSGDPVLEGYIDHYEYAVVLASSDNFEKEPSDDMYIPMVPSEKYQNEGYKVYSELKKKHICQDGVYYVTDDNGELAAKNIEAVKDNGTYYIADAVRISGDINAKVYIRKVYIADVKSSEVCIPVKVQKTCPAVSVSDIKIDRTANENDWFNTVPGISTSLYQRQDYEIPVKTFWKLKNAETSGVISEGNFDDRKNENESERSVIAPGSDIEDGRYSFEVYRIDEAGNESEKQSVILNIDQTPPEVKSIKSADHSDSELLANNTGSGNTFDYGKYFYNHGITLKTECDDKTSSINSIRYCLVDNEDPAPDAGDPQKWTDFPAEGISAEPNSRFRVYIRTEDNAGNVTVRNSDGIILDNQDPVGENFAPDITIKPEAPNSRGFYKNNVSVDISVMDPLFSAVSQDENGSCSGLRKVMYTISDGLNVREEVLYEKNESSLEIERGLKTSIEISADEFNSNDVVVTVTAWDNAGNSRTTSTEPGAIRIDKTAPVVSVVYDNNNQNADNEGFFNSPRTAKISVRERNFDPADITWKITKDGKQISMPVSSWSTVPGSGNGDNTVHTAEIRFDSDGEYTFDLEYSDPAENSSGPAVFAEGTVCAQKFTIDVSRPEITVSYDNNSGNGSFFNSSRTATVTIREHNFDASLVKYSVTASRGGKAIAGKMPELSEWKNSGDEHTATIKFAADGDYVFSIEATDKAGNRSGSINYGDSASWNRFTIDTSVEEPEITGIANGHSYKDDVNSRIIISDINIDTFTYKLLRTRLNEKDTDVTDQFISGFTLNDDGSYTADFSIDRIQENDGIYKLIVDVTDMAGNTSGKEITFSVNRFGSVYVFNDYLIDLQNSYNKKIDGQIVITEYNATKLVADSIKIDILCDSSPVTDVKYRSEPQHNQAVKTGNSGWYEYVYTIDPENFSRDGIYKIIVSSKDDAGNNSETTNYDDKEVLFRVDSTTPEITNVTGLEKRTVNSSAARVGFEVFDSIGIDEVKVLIDNREVSKWDTFEDLNNVSLDFEIPEGVNQKVRFIIKDKAGNITDTDEAGFTPAYRFEKEVTVSTNLFVRWYSNTTLFVSSIAAAAVAAAGGVFAAVRRKRKK